MAEAQTKHNDKSKANPLQSSHHTNHMRSAQASLISSSTLDETLLAGLAASARSSSSSSSSMWVGGESGSAGRRALRSEAIMPAMRKGVERT